MTDSYDGLDLLADVFEDTEDAPTPVERRDAGGNLLRLWPSPDDPRWSVDASFYPEGGLMAVRSVKWRQGPTGGPEIGSAALSGPGIGNGGEA
jgi:hypothetical protein